MPITVAHFSNSYAAAQCCSSLWVQQRYAGEAAILHTSASRMPVPIRSSLPLQLFTNHLSRKLCYGMHIQLESADTPRGGAAGCTAQYIPH